MNAKLIFPAVALVIGAGILATPQKVQAFSFGQFRDTLISRLAEKFGKNTEEVKVVFDEVRQERQAEMQAKFTEKLDQAVADGKITEAQKQLIVAKHQEIQAEREANRDEFQNMTPEERREAMQNRHEELETWAEENGIDFSFFNLGMGRMGRQGMRGGFGPRMEQ